jgi:hypothetical protein
LRQSRLRTQGIGTARFVAQVRVITFKDVNIDEVEKPELRLSELSLGSQLNS